MRDGFEAINEEIATRFGMLFAAGEVDGNAAVAESVVDSSEIINTLSGGGVSTVGYAAEDVERSSDRGLLSRVSGSGGSGNGGNRGSGSGDAGLDSANTTNRITSLVRKAALGRLTLHCDVQGAEKSLVVVGGPPEHLDRKGIERGRQWLEEETGSMEVRGGDYPLPSSGTVASLVLLSGVHHVPRFKELQQVAIEAQDNIAQRDARREDNLQKLVHDGAEELTSLF